MISVFYGTDRMKISREIEKILGKDYEVFEGVNLNAQDLANICAGNSLFFEKRKILIRDLTPMRGAKSEAGDSGDGSGEFDAYAELINYVNTEHEIVIWESAVPRKKSFKDFLKQKSVFERKIDAAKPVDAGKVFEIYDLALSDGGRAIEELKKIEDENDPYAFVGLMASQAIKKYQYRMGKKEKRNLEILAELDMKMKSCAVEPWRLVEMALIELSVK